MKNENVYSLPSAEVMEMGTVSVLCASDDFSSGNGQEYDFGDTGDWDF